MNTVFDLSDLPERRLQARRVVALQPHLYLDEAAHIAKRELATQLARTILESETFFKEQADTVLGTTVVEYRVDCIVLTLEEFAELKRQSFKEGLQHAAGFMGTTP